MNQLLSVGLGGMVVVVLAFALWFWKRRCRARQQRSALELCWQYQGDNETLEQALEFGAEWSPARVRPTFQQALARFREGRPPEDIFAPLVISPLSRRDRLILIALQTIAAGGSYPEGWDIPPSLPACTSNQRESQRHLLFSNTRRWLLVVFWTISLTTSGLLWWSPVHREAWLDTNPGRIFLGIIVGLLLGTCFIAGRLLSKPAIE